MRGAIYSEKLKWIEALVASPPDGCVEWPWSVTNTGYGILYYNDDNNTTQAILAHRHTLELWLQRALLPLECALHGLVTTDFVAIRRICIQAIALRICSTAIATEPLAEN